MFRGRIQSSTLVAIVSAPGFLVGQKLRQGDHWMALMLIPMTLLVVLLATLIMRQSE